MVNTFTYSHVHYLLSYKNFLDSSICIANDVNITLNRIVYLVAFKSIDRNAVSCQSRYRIDACCLLSCLSVNEKLLDSILDSLKVEC